MPSLIQNCRGAMNLVPLSSSKSADLLIWRCSPCKKYKNIRTDSVLSGHKLSFVELIVELIFYLSIKDVKNIVVSQLTGIS